jgi:prolyl-tRNA editing enzyme YbaK/EbsC (Cys-tRNA(Pro) deacylase)
VSQETSPSTRRVLAVLDEKNLAGSVVVLPDSTHTAAAAAAALGCEIAQIAKSIVFRAKLTNRVVLVIASGTNRVDTNRVGALVGEPLEKADAEFVRARTGFAIGGGAPVGHTGPVETFVDEDLFQHGVIWAAAGTPHAVFSMTASDAVTLTGGRVAAIK